MMKRNFVIKNEATMSKIYDQSMSVIAALNKRERYQVIRITPTVAPAPLPVTTSKFGGAPYLPEGVDAPTNSTGSPLGMIAQINCEELPDNDIYPKTGMLQFWIDPAHEFWGANFDAPTSQDNARVIYYEGLVVPNPDARLPYAAPGRYWPIFPVCSWL